MTTSRRQLPPPNRNGMYIALIVAAVILAGGIGWIARGLATPTNDSSPKKQVASNANEKGDSTKRASDEVEKQKSDSQSNVVDEPKSDSTVISKKNLLKEEPETNTDFEEKNLDLPKTKKKGPPKLADLSNYKKNPNRDPVRLPKTDRQSKKTKSNKTTKDSTSSDTTQKKLPNDTSQENSFSFPQQSTPIVFYQELIVDRQPVFEIEGIRSIEQKFKYRTISQLAVHPPNREGIRQVTQKVVGANLISADAMSQKTIADSLKKLIGQEFRFSLDRHQQLVEFKGKADKPAATDLKGMESLTKLLGGGLSGEGFMVSSVMDLDGWKEMAQMTFLLPEDKKQKWSGQMEHDWDSLGRWVGETRYEKKAKSGKKLRIDYAHWMRYEPAADGKGDLPFAISEAEFKSDEAGGRMQFDTEKRRIHSLIERFHVEGTLSASLLGKTVKLKIKEVQQFELFLHDQRPQ